MKNLIIVTRGCPGSGKDTFVKAAGWEDYTICPDDLRNLYRNPSQNEWGRLSRSMEVGRKVWTLANEFVLEKMKRSDFIVFNSTMTSHKNMAEILKLSRKYNYEVVVLDFVVDLETLKSRNESRKYAVPDDYLESSFEKMENRVMKGFKVLNAHDYLHFESDREISRYYVDHQKLQEDIYPNLTVEVKDGDILHFVGDIQGCFDPFERYLNDILPLKSNEKLVFLGDLMDRGPDNDKVLARCIELSKEYPDNIIWTLGNHECLDDNTEILTDSGWKSYDEINNGDMCLSYDIETDTSCWEKIDNVIVKNYKGEMHHYLGKRIDLLCTPNHRNLTRKYGGSEFSYKTSNEITNARHIFINSRKSSNMQICDEFTDDEIKLIAWLMTDSHKSKSYDYWTIYQSKEQNVLEIEEILENLNITYKKTERNRDITEICGKKLKSIKRQFEFRIPPKNNHYIDNLIKKKNLYDTRLECLSPHQFNIFKDTLIKADGTYYEDGNNAMLYGSHEFLSIVQRYFILYGIGCSLTKDNRDEFRLNITNKNQNEIRIDTNKNIVDYDGIVWCISTRLTNFMIRRNGKHHFTGNCHYFHWITGATVYSKEFTDKTQPQLERLGIDKADHIKFMNKFNYFTRFKNSEDDGCYENNVILATHAGVSSPRYIYDIDMYSKYRWFYAKGAGKYGAKVDDIFNEYCSHDIKAGNPNPYYQFHGHRNSHKFNNDVEFCRSFNLEGKVEFDGELRTTKVVYKSRGELNVELKSYEYIRGNIQDSHNNVVESNKY